MKVKIQHKITIIFCTIMAVAFISVFGYLDNTLKDYIFQRIRTAMVKEALLVKLFLEDDFPGYPRLKEIDAVVDQAGEALQSRVTLIGTDGVVIGDSDMSEEDLEQMENHLYRPEVQTALEGGIGESQRFSTTLKRNMLYIAVAYGEGEHRGVVRLALPLSEIDTVSMHLKRILLFSLLFAFLAAFVASFLAARILAKPIRNVSEAARKLADGDFSRKIIMNTGDELEELSNSFNYMAEEISGRIKEVTENRARLEAVFLSMFDGVMVVDSRETVILMNQTLRKLLDVKEDPAGKKPLEVLRNIEVQETIREVLGRESGLISREISLILPERKILKVHATPISRDNIVEGAVLVFHDITELRRLEDMRKDFVANVSHELRTPASNIKGFTETLLGGALGDEDNSEEFVRIIQENSDRLVNLIDDLLNLSKLESGKTTLKKEKCAPASFVDKVIEELSEAARHKGITLRNEVEPGVASIPGDIRMLEQVLFNLVDNAIKYTNEGGTIVVSASETKDHVEISVSDNGIGIPEEDLPRVFERFYSVHKDRSRKMGGTGLGLSIVKHIVNDHGGTVSVRSKPGKGSTFTFTIPKA